MKLCYAPSETLPVIRQVSYLCIRRPSGYKVSFSDGRPFNSFLYTASGRMEYSPLAANAPALQAPAGTLVYLPAGTCHISRYCGGANKVQMIQFDLSAPPDPSLSHPRIVPLADAGRLFAEIQNDLQANEREDGYYLLHRCLELMWRTRRAVQTLPPAERKLRPALQEMQNHYADDKKIPYYAALCGMSEPGFRRLFKACTGVSPLEYRNRMRLEQARRLLRSGEFTVEETAYTVGFSSSSFFCRCYKKAFGHTPGQE